MVAVACALLEETRVLRGRLEARRSYAGYVSGLFAGVEIALLPIGIGACRLGSQTETIRNLAPSFILNTGFAGATRTLLLPGDLLAAVNFSSPELVELVIQTGQIEAAGEFAAVSSVADAETKRALGRTGRSLAVDMESAALAEFSRNNEIPLLTLRMISDGINEEIPAVFLGNKSVRLSDGLHATRFAIRMLALTRKLADRLEIVLPRLSTSSETSSSTNVTGSL